MKQILFVDDKPAIGKVLSVYLGKENELVYFEDPVRAIEWQNEGNEPALIISDIRMPKMTGSEFERQFTFQGHSGCDAFQ